MISIKIILFAFTFIQLPFILADTAEYGSITYDTGPHNSFSMQLMLTLTNEARANESIPSLVIDTRLYKAATFHCSKMSEFSVFDHTANDGSIGDRITDQGFTWTTVAENIYTDEDGGDAHVANKAYMESEGHRANIMNADYTRVGFGVCGGLDGSTTTYWVSNFGAEMNDSGNANVVVGVD